jgi:hypothetical protein
LEENVKYMLLIYLEENSLSESERSNCYRDSAAFARDLHARGQYVSSSPLQPTSTATSLRIKDGKTVITDGPFAETREQLGGYFIIQAENLDQAIDIAGRIPAGRWGTVEIRPILEIADLPHETGAADVTRA